MFSILIWTIYGIFVGSIAKSIVPGEERLGFFQTAVLGVIGSYFGGAIMYLLGKYDALSPAGLVMGVVGSCVALIVYNKLQKQ
jgi:uncharacterized membrane protein YeaQ/YmgE (transglycosylase-associated protein family)